MEEKEEVGEEADGTKEHTVDMEVMEEVVDMEEREGGTSINFYVFFGANQTHDLT